MARIVLIRPGATSYDEQGRVLGALDIPLSEQGLQQANAMADQLAAVDLRCVYSAPCSRSLQTAERIGQVLGIRNAVLEKLRNVDCGLWQGMLIQDLKRHQPRVYRMWQELPDAVCPPEGEPLEDARERIRGCLEKLCRKHDQDTIALVVPEPLASLVAELLGGHDLGDMWKASQELAHWEVIDTAQVAVSSAT